MMKLLKGFGSVMAGVSTFCFTILRRRHCLVACSSYFKSLSLRSPGSRKLFGSFVLKCICDRGSSEDDCREKPLLDFIEAASASFAL